jgi:hypothetical protein
VLPLPSCAETLLLTFLASCTTQHLAEKYFRQAAAFMNLYDCTYATGPTLYSFDVDSLMLYDSEVGKPPGQEESPLMSVRNSYPLRMGGNRDPNLAAPSFWDIKHVLDLYPPPPPPIEPFDFGEQSGAPPGERSVTVEATQSEQPWLKVEGPGEFTTTVGPVPTEQPSAAPPANRTTKRWYSAPLDVDARPEDYRA